MKMMKIKNQKHSLCDLDASYMEQRMSKQEFTMRYRTHMTIVARSLN